MVGNTDWYTRVTVAGVEENVIFCSHKDNENHLPFSMVHTLLTKDSRSSVAGCEVYMCKPKSCFLQQETTSFTTKAMEDLF